MAENDLSLGWRARRKARHDNELLTDHDKTNNAASAQEHDAVHDRIFARLGRKTGVDVEHQWLDALREQNDGSFPIEKGT